MIDPREITNGAWRAGNGQFWMLPDRRFRADGRKQIEWTRLRALVRGFAKTCERIANSNPAIGLRAIQDARRQLDRVEYELVAVARGATWSWRDVGEALGMSAAAAHKRFGRGESRRSRRDRQPKETERSTSVDGSQIDDG